MKKIASLVVLLFGLVAFGHAQKLSKEEVAKYETEIKTLLNYLEETLNFIGDSTASAAEKEIVFTESWSKIFIDDKVQIEDDLDVDRKLPINKDVQSYLKDIDFFFKNAIFKLDLQNISNSTREDGNVYFKATLSRQLTALTINDESVNNVKKRFVEVNLDRQNNSLKIASIYTVKINEKEALRNWWNNLSNNWKTRLGKDIRLYDSIPLGIVSKVTNKGFITSCPTIDYVTGDTVIQEKEYKNDLEEVDLKLKLVTQKRRVDVSGLREIISVEPLSELSDLMWLDISGTSVDDISALRNANKLKVLRANSTLIEDVSPLKYALTLEELEVSNANVEDLSVLSSLKDLVKLDLSNTTVKQIPNLKNFPKLIYINLSGSNITSIGFMRDFEQLRKIDISNTSVSDLSPIKNLKTLQSLDISGTQVKNLLALSELENLRELYCSNTTISSLAPLKNHKKLVRIYCDHSNINNAEASAFTKDNPSALIIFDTEALTNWWNGLPLYWKALFSKQIQIESEPTTEQLHQIINLQELDLSDNTFIQSLMPVSRLTNLKSLNIAHTEIPNLFAIQGLANLEALNIEHTYINDLSPLHDMPNLKYLNIMNTPVSDLLSLVDDNHIEEVMADNTSINREAVFSLKERQRQVTVVYQSELLQDWWNGLDDIWKTIFKNHVGFQNQDPNALELQKVVDLKEIVITPATPIVSLEPLETFNWLERLTINNQGIVDLSPLHDKKYLVELNVQNNPINSLSPLENNTMMELLNVENTKIKDLDALSKMSDLVTLNASGTPIKSLKPLSELTHLENLFINNTNIKSIAPIEEIASLKQLKVYNTKVSKRSIEALQEKRIDLNIVYY